MRRGFTFERGWYPIPHPSTTVLFVRREVLEEQREALTQQGNLNFWRPSVGFMTLIGGEDLPLCFTRQCHSKGDAPCLLLISFRYVIQNTTFCGASPFGLPPAF